MVALHGTFIGGTPFLPEGYTWPKGRSGRPLTFVIQVNLADIPTLDGYPSHGLLQLLTGNDLFFGSEIEDTCDLDNLRKDADGWELRFIPRIPGTDSADLPPTSQDAIPAPSTFERYLPFVKEADYVFENSVELNGRLASYRGSEHFFEKEEDERMRFLDEDEMEYETCFVDSTPEVVQSSDKLCVELVDILGEEEERVSNIIFGPAGTFANDLFFPEGYTHLLNLSTDNFDTLIWGDCGTAHVYVRDEILAYMRQENAEPLILGPLSSPDEAPGNRFVTEKELPVIFTVDCF